jgi:hypothetical protein
MRRIDATLRRHHGQWMRTSVHELPETDGWKPGDEVAILPRDVADALVAVAEAARNGQCCYNGGCYGACPGCIALARLGAANAGGGA